MIVLDASAAVELLLATPRGVAIAARIARSTLHAPHVLDLEVTSALRVLESRRSISARDAVAALADLSGIDLTRYPHEPLLSRIWELRGNLTPYDSAYLALAEYLRAPLVTCDARLAKAPGNPAKIELFR